MGAAVAAGVVVGGAIARRAITSAAAVNMRGFKLPLKEVHFIAVAAAGVGARSVHLG